MVFNDKLMNDVLHLPHKAVFFGTVERSGATEAGWNL